MFVELAFQTLLLGGVLSIAVWGLLFVPRGRPILVKPTKPQKKSAINCFETMVNCSTDAECQSRCQQGQAGEEMKCNKAPNQAGYIGFCTPAKAVFTCSVATGGLATLTPNPLDGSTPIFSCTCSLPQFFSGPSCDTINSNFCGGGTVEYNKQATRLVSLSSKSCSCPANHVKMERVNSSYKDTSMCVVSDKIRPKILPSKMTEFFVTSMDNLIGRNWDQPVMERDESAQEDSSPAGSSFAVTFPFMFVDDNTLCKAAQTNNLTPTGDPDAVTVSARTLDECAAKCYEAHGNTCTAFSFLQQKSANLQLTNASRKNCQFSSNCGAQCLCFDKETSGFRTNKLPEGVKCSSIAGTGQDVQEKCENSYYKEKSFKMDGYSTNPARWRKCKYFNFIPGPQGHPEGCFYSDWPGPLPRNLRYPMCSTVREPATRVTGIYKKCNDLDSMNLPSGTNCNDFYVSNYPFKPGQTGQFCTDPVGFERTCNLSPDFCYTEAPTPPPDLKTPAPDPGACGYDADKSPSGLDLDACDVTAGPLKEKWATYGILSGITTDLQCPESFVMDKASKTCIQQCGVGFGTCQDVAVADPDPTKTTNKTFSKRNVCCPVAPAKSNIKQPKIGQNMYSCAFNPKCSPQEPGGCDTSDFQCSSNILPNPDENCATYDSSEGYCLTCIPNYTIQTKTLAGGKTVLLCQPS